MNIGGIIDGINKPNAVPGDYLQDGLLFCGKCHTPKQMHGEGLLAGKKLSITCACKRLELEAEKQREDRRKADELRNICLPETAMHEDRFDKADAQEARHIVLARQYVEKWQEVRSKNIGLMFWGNTGTGKSFTAHCIANALLDQQIPVKLVSSVDLVSRLMEKDGRDAYIKSLSNAPLLIIDDVGAERDTAFSREQLCTVIDKRSESRKPLIVTTNYTVKEMDACTDHALQRIFNRLKGLCVPVAVIGESRRNQIGAKKLKEARSLLGL